MRKHLPRLAILMIALFHCSYSVSQEMTLGGNAGGNGGDFEGALVQAGLHQKILPDNSFSQDAIHRFKVEFWTSAVEGLFALLILSDAGYEFSTNESTLVNIDHDLAYRYLKALEGLMGPNRFSLDNTLTSNGRVSTAKNFIEERRVVLNPSRWATIGYRYKASYARKLKAAIAVHEVLTLMQKPLESSNNYPISIALVEFEENYKSIKSSSPVFPKVGSQIALEFDKDDSIISDNWNSGRFVVRFNTAAYHKLERGLLDLRSPAVYFSGLNRLSFEQMSFVGDVAVRAAIRLKSLAELIDANKSRDPGLLFGAKLYSFIFSSIMTELATVGDSFEYGAHIGVLTPHIYSKIGYGDLNKFLNFEYNRGRFFHMKKNFFLNAFELGGNNKVGAN